MYTHFNAHTGIHYFNVRCYHCPRVFTLFRRRRRRRHVASNMAGVERNKLPPSASISSSDSPTYVFVHLTCYGTFSFHSVVTSGGSLDSSTSCTFVVTSGHLFKSASKHYRVFYICHRGVLALSQPGSSPDTLNGPQSTGHVSIQGVIGRHTHSFTHPLPPHAPSVYQDESSTFSLTH